MAIKRIECGTRKLMMLNNRNSNHNHHHCQTVCGGGAEKGVRRDLASTENAGGDAAVPCLCPFGKSRGAGGGAGGGKQQKQQRHHHYRHECFFSISVAVPAEEEAVGGEGAGSIDRRAGDDDGRGRAIGAAGQRQRAPPIRPERPLGMAPGWGTGEGMDDEEEREGREQEEEEEKC
ncbi:hypothetical protein niasHT_021179 [Heterodera trifolii]|uniref:Uncharacterized protein n=1 Tax=Heterodera trifolii TaxID=157864 RepID=A0ABD2KFI2_9BILA